MSECLWLLRSILSTMRKCTENICNKHIFFYHVAALYRDTACTGGISKLQELIERGQLEAMQAILMG